MRNAETVTFGGSGLNRAAHLRGDSDGLARSAAEGKSLLLWRGKPLVDSSGALAWLGAARLAEIGAAAPLLLGLDDDGKTALLAADLPGWEPPAQDMPEGGFFDATAQTHPLLGPDLSFQELRAIMASLSPRDAELAATARGLMEWHRTHGFCATCGQPSTIVQGGWQRSCKSCGAQHFPRTDPVVIMLITHGNRVLLGRNAAWPPGMFSLLAGFMEPGETIEAAVRREVFEEAGVRVGSVGYLASQPWPFPASLMIGCQGEALDDTITIDPAELEQARWVSREEMVQAFAGTHPEIKPSRRGAIAQFLIANWLADRLD